MKTIIAEKPSVAREIGQIVGATKREAGYLSGNGYHVTWAFGHLATPALPDGYGIKGFHRDNLPILPSIFSLFSHQVKTDKGYKADNDVLAQIKVIAQLFHESDKNIVATDAVLEEAGKIAPEDLLIQGISAEELKDFNDAYLAYKTVSTDPREANIERSGYTKQIANLFIETTNLKKKKARPSGHSV